MTPSIIACQVRVLEECFLDSPKSKLKTKHYQRKHVEVSNDRLLKLLNFLLNSTNRISGMRRIHDSNRHAKLQRFVLKVRYFNSLHRLPASYRQEGKQFISYETFCMVGIMQNWYSCFDFRIVFSRVDSRSCVEVSVKTTTRDVGRATGTRQIPLSGLLFSWEIYPL